MLNVANFAMWRLLGGSKNSSSSTWSVTLFNKLMSHPFRFGVFPTSTLYDGLDHLIISISERAIPYPRPLLSTSMTGSATICWQSTYSIIAKTATGWPSYTVPYPTSDLPKLGFRAPAISGHVTEFPPPVTLIIASSPHSVVSYAEYKQPMENWLNSTTAETTYDKKIARIWRSPAILGKPLTSYRVHVKRQYAMHTRCNVFQALLLTWIVFLATIALW